MYSVRFFSEMFFEMQQELFWISILHTVAFFPLSLSYLCPFLPISYLFRFKGLNQPFKEEAQAALFKDPVRTAL